MQKAVGNQLAAEFKDLGSKYWYVHCLILADDCVKGLGVGYNDCSCCSCIRDKSKKGKDYWLQHTVEQVLSRTVSTFYVSYALASIDNVQSMT